MMHFGSRRRNDFLHFHDRICMESRDPKERHASESTSSSNSGQYLAQPKLPVPRFVFRLMLIGCVFLYSSYTILVHLCEIDGRVPFSNAALVLFIEISKFLISIAIFMIEVKRKQQGSVSSTPHYFAYLRSRLAEEFSPSDDGKTQANTKATSFFWVLAPFSVPAILYTITNNLAVDIQMEMDPATYQVLGNFKIPTTAILFRLIIRRPISYRQWFALFLLLVAGVTNGLSSFEASDTKTSSVLHITLKGVFMITIYCAVSGLASVYTEYVFKKRAYMSLNIQNATLYVFGIIINGLLYVFQEAIAAGNFNLLRGFSFYTWIIVLTQAFTGIFIGFVMKYASSITRLFIISSAMIGTTVFSILIFGLVLKIDFVLSGGFVLFALILYYY